MIKHKMLKSYRVEYIERADPFTVHNNIYDAYDSKDAKNQFLKTVHGFGGRPEQVKIISAKKIGEKQNKSFRFPSGTEQIMSRW